MKKILLTGLLVAAVCASGSTFRPVLEQERSYVGATHVATITHADLTETNADTAQKIELIGVKAKQRVELIGMELVEAFNAGDNLTGSVTVVVGDGASGSDFYLDSTELDSNKTEIWNKFGRAYQGVTTATSLNVTNVSVASEIDCLDSITPSYAAVLSAIGTPATSNAITGFASHTTASVLTGLGNPTTINALINATLELQTATFTVSETEYTVVTNVTISLTDSAAVAGYASTTTADAITALGTAQTVAAVTGYSPTTNNVVSAITSNVITAAKTLGLETESQTRVTALSDGAAGRKVYTSDDTIDFTFTPNSENALSENTTGELRFYFKIVR